MYDPIYDMVTERQSHILQVADNSRKLAGLKAARPGLRRRLIYTIGGMLIAFGTRLRGSAPEPAPSASYGMTEGCS